MLAAQVFSRGDGVWTWSNEAAETRMCVHDGRVAWVHCSSLEVYLADRLADALDVPIGDLRHHLVACRQSNRRLAEYLAEIGVMSADGLRRVLETHNAEHIAEFLVDDWDWFTFVPTTDRYTRTLTFGIDELLARLHGVATEEALRSAVAALEYAVEDIEDDALGTGDASEAMAHAIQSAMTISGAIGAALVDYQTGDYAAIGGDEVLDIQTAAAGYAELVRAELRLVEALGNNGGLDDILITTRDHYHLLRPVDGTSCFMYVVLDRRVGNLAMARYDLREIEHGLSG